MVLYPCIDSKAATWRIVYWYRSEKGQKKMLFVFEEISVECCDLKIMQVGHEEAFKLMLNLSVLSGGVFIVSSGQACWHIGKKATLLSVYSSPCLVLTCFR